MNHFLRFAVLAMLSLGFFSCGDDRDELIQGVWEVVNVANIQAEKTEHWHFENGQVRIYEVQINNPGSKVFKEEGKYLIKTRRTKHYIKMSGLSVADYNTDWDIITLTSRQLVISNDFAGGILYKEFIKMQ